MPKLDQKLGKDFMRQEDTNILRYLPDFLSDNSTTFKVVGDSQSAEHDRQKAALLDLFKQCFISTATWGLTLWENDLFLTVNESDSVENRRRRIWNKLQSKKTSTIEFLTELLNKYVEDQDGLIVEIYDKYLLEYHVKDGSITNWTDLIDTIHQWKPAHLGFHFITNTDLGESVYFSGVVSDYEELYIPCSVDYTMTIGSTEAEYIESLLNHSRF
jgi:hypothetical protein|nr:MAG TPA: tail protein [Caudoviricetes sp.]